MKPPGWMEIDIGPTTAGAGGETVVRMYVKVNRRRTGFWWFAIKQYVKAAVRAAQERSPR